MRRVHSATMSIMATPAQPLSTEEIEPLPELNLQQPGTAEDPDVSSASPTVPSMAGLNVAEAPCPLDAEALAKALRPLMRFSLRSGDLSGIRPANPRNAFGSEAQLPEA